MKTQPLIKFTVPLKAATVAWLKLRAKRRKLGPRAVARAIIERMVYEERA